MLYNAVRGEAIAYEKILFMIDGAEHTIEILRKRIKELEQGGRSGGII